MGIIRSISYSVIRIKLNIFKVISTMLGIWYLNVFKPFLNIKLKFFYDSYSYFLISTKVDIEISKYLKVL